MTRKQQLAVAVTCLVASVTYAGAVTTWAMGVFVLPGVAGAALLTTLLAARRMSGMAIGVVGALVVGWAELANIWTGTANGPAARSTAFAAGWTVIAVVLAHSRRPALFLAGVAGVVAGALLLGAAGEVRIVVVATAVSAALTLGSIERSRRNWTAPPRRGTALVLLSLLAGAAAAGAVLLQAQTDPRDPALTAQGRQHPGIEPAWTDPLATASKPPAKEAAGQQRTSPRPKPASPDPTPQTPRDASKPETGSQPARADKGSSRSIWLDVVAVIVLLVLVLAALLAARLLSTRIAWRRVRRRLAAGAPTEQVTGAWAWTRLRLEACRLPLAMDVSPDVIVAGRAMDGVPAGVYKPLQALAARATTAAFSREQSLRAAEVAVAWMVADRADRSAREHLTRRARARLAFRGPAVAALSEPPQHREVAGRMLTTTQAAIIVAASGLVLCFATLAGFIVFKIDNRAVSAVSTSTKPAGPVASTAEPAVTAPTPRPAVVSPAQAPSRILAPGDTGPQVRILQRALATLGFLPSKPDGGYGPATQTAVERFQASQGLPQVGVVGPQTLAALQDALARRSRP